MWGMLLKIKNLKLYGTNQIPKNIYHLPYSQSKTDDDKTLSNDELLKEIKRRMKK